MEKSHLSKLALTALAVAASLTSSVQAHEEPSTLNGVLLAASCGNIRSSNSYNYGTSNTPYQSDEINSGYGNVNYDSNYGNYGTEEGMPVCFLTNNDITGGNSGSPVINGKGELIGLAFDGNWEAMSGDIAFEPELQRCIAVDIRYVLFIMDKFAGAKHLVDEMDVVW